MDNIITLPVWENYCKSIQNNNYVIGDIFKFNECLLDEQYFQNLSNKIVILLNPDCDFPPPKLSNTYEFDPKYSCLNHDCSILSYKDKIDKRSIKLIEKYNIKIICYSSSIFHENILCVPLGPTWQTCITQLNMCDKSNICYANFGIPTISRWFGNPRLETYNTLKNKKFILFENTRLDDNQRKNINNTNYNNYFINLNQSKFSICPRGCGIDSYRVYDSILFNCIPIMLNNEEFYLNFKELPILFIGDYNELTEDFLNEQWNKINILHFDKNKLHIDYWKMKIK
jgi:hypothetical protein